MSEPSYNAIGGEQKALARISLHPKVSLFMTNLGNRRQSRMVPGLLLQTCYASGIQNLIPLETFCNMWGPLLGEPYWVLRPRLLEAIQRKNGEHGQRLVKGVHYHMAPHQRHMDDILLTQHGQVTVFLLSKFSSHFSILMWNALDACREVIAILLNEVRRMQNKIRTLQKDSRENARREKILFEDLKVGSQKQQSALCAGTKRAMYRALYCGIHIDGKRLIPSATAAIRMVRSGAYNLRDRTPIGAPVHRYIAPEGREMANMCFDMALLKLQRTPRFFELTQHQKRVRILKEYKTIATAMTPDFPCRSEDEVVEWLAYYFKPEPTPNNAMDEVA